jgi:ASC-1-like (ASCH) protein
MPPKTLHIAAKFFPSVASGEKTVEGRLARADGRGPGGIQAGDVVAVATGAAGSAPRPVFRRVTKLEHFPSFGEMLERHLARALPGVKSAAAGAAVYRDIYGDRDKARGVTAIHLEPAQSTRLAPRPGSSPHLAAASVRLERNSTSFIFEVTRMLERVKADPKDPTAPAADEYYGVPVKGLRLHQARTLVYATAPEFRTDARGLLVYQEMGTGKGVLMAAIMQQTAKAGTPCVLFASKGLMGNFGTSVKKYEEISGETFLAGHVRYASMNASNAALQIIRAVDEAAMTCVSGEAAQGLGATRVASEQAERAGANPDEREVLKEMSAHLAQEIASFDDVAIFIDEAHLFGRAVTNGSANATAVYRILAKSPRARVFLFTGTPGVDDPFELAILLDMVGPVKPLPLPENYLDFRRMFVTDVPKDGGNSKGAPKAEGNSPENFRGAPKAEGNSRENFQGVHVEAPRNAGKFMNRIVGLVSYHAADAAGLPKLLPYKEHRVKMDRVQWEQYSQAREREREEVLEQQKDKGRKGRKAATPSLQRPGNQGSSTYRQRSRQLGDSYYVRSAKPPGNVAGNVPLKLHSPKAAAALNIVNKAGHLVVLYSQYIDRGCRAVAAAAAADGWVEFGSPESRRDPAAHSGKVFALVTGEIDLALRLQLVAAANSAANADGAVLKLVILSVVGALGLSFLYSNEVIIYEPYWNKAMHDQIVARVRRFDSFEGAPDAEKKRVVQPHVLLAVAPDGAGDAAKFEAPTDVHMWESAQKRIGLLNAFRALVRRASIEAVASWNREPPAPLMCEPTGARLFAADFAADLAMANPCVPFESAEISALPVTLDGVEYFYAPNEGAPFGVELFRYDESLNAYAPLSPGDPAYSLFLERERGG